VRRVNMALGATPPVSAQGGGAAVAQGLGRRPLVRRQRMRLGERLEVLLQDGLHGQGHAAIKSYLFMRVHCNIYTPVHASSSPPQIGPAQGKGRAARSTFALTLPTARASFPRAAGQFNGHVQSAAAQDVDRGSWLGPPLDCNILFVATGGPG